MNDISTSPQTQCDQDMIQPVMKKPTLFAEPTFDGTKSLEKSPSVDPHFQSTQRPVLILDRHPKLKPKKSPSQSLPSILSFQNDTQFVVY